MVVAAVVLATQYARMGEEGRVRAWERAREWVAGAAGDPVGFAARTWQAATQTGALPLLLAAVVSKLLARQFRLRREARMAAAGKAD